jgi:hypothetical protein
MYHSIEYVKWVYVLAFYQIRNATDKNIANELWKTLGWEAWTHTIILTPPVPSHQSQWSSIYDHLGERLKHIQLA